MTMSKQLPVVAAIPNYNMGDYLRRLLPQVLEQGYDRVFVLDDASTDHSIDVVAEFGDDVKMVRSPGNRGASANRNQIIDQVGDDALIHFIDADMDLETSDTASVAREVFTRYADREVGVIGGLVSRIDGSQEPYNYGPVFSLRANLTGSFPELVEHFRERPRLAKAIARLGAPAMQYWPNTFEDPAPIETYWVHEGNMLIHSGIFKSVGGYDPLIREHEAQDLAIRLAKRGIKRRFDPSIKVVHHHVDVRGKYRGRQQAKAILYLLGKHGFVRWLTAPADPRVHTTFGAATT
jgi:GT2 family glycosyltransferase